MDRRTLLTGGAAALGAVGLSAGSWGTALAAPAVAQPGASPYGALLAPDARGLRLPPRFRSRVVARSGVVVPGTTYVWHSAPDGAAVFPTSTGGWIYVSNSEVGEGRGGASAIRFSATGTVESAYRILSGTSRNCSGGATPWRRWLSGEETSRGYVYECDPRGRAASVRRPAMGRFNHEAAAVDPARRVVYLTEDEPDGRFYRFRPATWPDLSAGVLEVACAGAGPGSVVWRRVPDPLARETRTRHQVPGSLVFNGGEGCFYDRDVCFFTTKGDNRVWAYRADTATVDTVYDAAEISGTAPLRGVDGLAVSRLRDLYVAEDGDDMQINVIRGGTVSPFLQVLGHSSSEVTGIAFDPEGGRMYFSSQRGTGSGGITYEVRGPF